MRLCVIRTCQRKSHKPYRERYLFALILLGFSFAVHAQDDVRLYESAQDAYEMGLFEKANDLLSNSLDLFHGETRIGVYRLLALCNLNMDKPEVAETWPKPSTGGSASTSNMTGI